MYASSFEAEIERRLLINVSAVFSVAMQKPETGYEFWFHRQLDYRTSAKSNT
jgi:hypothetical protein